jgi:hypothetical protein
LLKTHVTSAKVKAVGQEGVADLFAHAGLLYARCDNTHWSVSATPQCNWNTAVSLLHFKI